MNKRFCQKCGKQIDTNAEFCSYCGEKQKKPQSNDNNMQSPQNSNSNIVTAFKHNWDNAFFISGRTSRADYWWNYLDLVIICAASYMLLGTLEYNALLMILCSIVYAFMVIISFTSSIRRLHDTNKSGHFMWLYFIPIIGSIILLVLFAMPQKNSERFNIKKDQKNIWYKKVWPWLVIVLLSFMYFGFFKVINVAETSLQQQIEESSYDDSSSDDSSDSSDTSDDDSDSSEEASSDDDTSSQDVNPEDYKSGISYDNLARNPDDYKGEKVSFTGKVMQTIPDDDEEATQMRVAIDGDYDNVMLVTISNDNLNGSRVLENDKITFYGKSGGIITYKSTMGAQIQIPSVAAYRLDDSGKASEDY